MIPQVNQYLIDGCGRCPLYKTPQCKVHTWVSELKLLREIALNSELKEEYKWSQPCYTLNGKNVLLVTAFKDYACIAFFKGALLKDEQNVLHAPGENSNHARQLRYIDVQSILDQNDIIEAYIREAIEIERSGKKVVVEKKEVEFPQELIEAFEEDAALEKAFHALTPGRQRSYLLHFSQAKQSATKTARIKKSAEKIFLGKGFNEY